MASQRYTLSSNIVMTKSPQSDHTEHKEEKSYSINAFSLFLLSAKNDIPGELMLALMTSPQTPFISNHFLKTPYHIKLWNY